MVNDEIREVVSNGKLNMVTEVVQRALDSGADSDEVLDAMMVAMDEVGDKFQNNDIYVPEMLIAAKTMQRGVTVLEPKLATASLNHLGKIIIGTVQGDLHDIGKNLVKIMLQSAGFEVIDLGIDVPPEDFIKALKDNPDCNIIAISALLTFTLPSMQETVEAIRKTKTGAKVKIMVGGAPVNEEFAKKIGADAYSADAIAAAKVAKSFVGK